MISVLKYTLQIKPMLKRSLRPRFKNAVDGDNDLFLLVLDYIEVNAQFWV